MSEPAAQSEGPEGLRSARGATRPQREITQRGALLDQRGRLNRPGWSRQPYFDTNLEDARPGFLGRFRVKRWDYYGIWTPEVFASVTLADVGYVGLPGCYIVDFAPGRNPDHTKILPPGNAIYLPRNSVAGDAYFEGGGMRIRFPVDAGRRRVELEDPSFDGGRGLRLEVDLACPPEHESIVVATPMAGGCFYYNRKINGLRASGTIAWGDRRFDVRPEQCLGQLDWGRGVWPYFTHWIWASGNAFLPDGRVLGLNLGGGFGDLTFATENSVFVDGRLHKLGDVRFDFDASDYKKPWRMVETGGRLDLELRPTFERVARSNLLAVRSEVHQVFGTYHGHVVLDGGERIEVSNLSGFAEEHYARW